MWIESGKSCTFAKTFRNMRVLIINTSEKTGGAAIAARRLMESLHTAGTDVKMLVLHKESQSEQVIPVGKDWQRNALSSGKDWLSGRIISSAGRISLLSP